MSADFIASMENFIKDENKKVKPYWYNEDDLPSFNRTAMNIFSKIVWGKVGGFEYYRTPFQIFGQKTTAFYKSLNESVYHIEIENDVPINYYNIFTFTN